MHIYPDNNYKINTNELSQYLQYTDERLEFNTNEGKIELFGNKIYKIIEKSHDDTFELNNKFNFIVYNSNFQKKEIYYIPIDYKYIKKQTKQYLLTKNSIVTLHVVNDSMFYFTTKEKIITSSVQEDLITFLSLLKLYN
jgi:hypothetical protein